MSCLYNEGHRRLQDEHRTRRLADRFEEKTVRTEFSDADRQLIEGCLHFFLATADADGRPDCSFKGGMPGFVRVTGPSELAFPDYDGNGMFRSLGNVTINPHVGLLFLIMHEDKPRRLRVNGTAVIRRDDPLLDAMDGARLIVRVTARAIFPNCSRYIPTMRLVAPSPASPRPHHVPPQPGWKELRDFKDYVPR
jgi:predicted pyridoxine 5'-phosphate oxidase superfamily flavin-nucleotide-binding protein